MRGLRRGLRGCFQRRRFTFWERGKRDYHLMFSDIDGAAASPSVPDGATEVRVKLKLTEGFDDFLWRQSFNSQRVDDKEVY